MVARGCFPALGSPGRHGAHQARQGWVHRVNWLSPVFEGPLEPLCSKTGSPCREIMGCAIMGHPIPQAFYYYFIAVTFRIGHLLHAFKPFEIHELPLGEWMQGKVGTKRVGRTQEVCSGVFRQGRLVQ